MVLRALPPLAQVISQRSVVVEGVEVDAGVALLQRADVFSVPATYGESFGLYLPEAWAARGRVRRRDGNGANGSPIDRRSTLASCADK